MGLLDAVIRAFGQVFTPALRSVLWKSVALAVGLLIVGAVALHRLFVWFADKGANLLLQWTNGGYSGPIGVAESVVAVLAALGLFVAFFFLVPPVTALVGSLFVDEIAETVEKSDYPGQPVGTALPVGRAMLEAAKFFAVVLAINLAALPTLLIAGLGVIVFFVANAYLLGREYFEMAAMRYHAPADARALRRAHSGKLFVAGLPIAVLVSIPVLNLLTPIFATAYMVHVHKGVMAERAGLPARPA
jgi:CysZ protein